MYTVILYNSFLPDDIHSSGGQMATANFYTNDSAISFAVTSSLRFFVGPEEFRTVAALFNGDGQLMGRYENGLLF